MRSYSIKVALRQTSRRLLPGLCLALCGLLFLKPLLPVVHADGGAPNLAYIAGGGSGISIIDIAQTKVTKNIALGATPSMVYLSIDGRYLYITQPTLNRVSKLVASTGTVVCSATVTGQPALEVFDPGDNRLYVAGNGASTLTALDGNDCVVKQTIQTNGPVQGMALAQIGSGVNGGTGNQVWFSTTSTLNVFQLPSKIQTINIPGGPQYVSIPQGATVYVTTHQGTIVAVSLQDLQVTAPLLTGGDFGPMDYDAFTAEVYVPDRKHNLVDVLTPIYYGSTVPQEPNHVITLGVQPQSIAITSDGNLAFIALSSGNIVMYDVPGKQVLNTLYVGGSPHFIITGLYPPNAAQNTNANGTPIPVVALVVIAIVALLVLVAIVMLLVVSRRSQADKQT